MNIDTLDPAAVRAQPPVQSKLVAEPEQTRPVRGTTESLGSGLDPNRERSTVEERDRGSDPRASTYDARGNQKEPPDPQPQAESETVDIFV